MKFKPYLILVILLAFSFTTCSPKMEKATTVPPTAANNIIPKPVSVTVNKDEKVHINGQTAIVADPIFSKQATYLKEQLFNQCGLKLSIQPQPLEKEGSAILLRYDSVEITKPEMYFLTIKDKRIVLQARDVEGVVHGIQTLLQLLPLTEAETIILPSLAIEDYPRFAYRGMHLDVSRHFFPPDFIKKYIDYLAFHKFNTFHWHLTDDQGWRIEIKSYPKLTEVGAWRDSTIISHHMREKPDRYDGYRSGGYYTQEEVKDIIAYAAVRGITIIPEIDIPGHSRAAIASYPEFSTNPDTVWTVATRWGTFKRMNNVLAPTPATFEFLERTFGEIADLFPSPYIHIGGDECNKKWWKADPETQAFIEEHGLKDEIGLQTYIIHQVIHDLEQKGKKVIGWDDILEGKIDTSAIIMNWQRVDAAIEAAQKNHDVIMTPGEPLYFNYYQSREPDSLNLFGYTTLDAVYQYEPIPEKIDSLGLSHRILGAQGNVWTEYMRYPSKVEYMIFPRMTALSEVLWTKKDKKDYANFKRRLKETAIPRYNFWASGYFKDYEYWTSEK